MWRTRGGAEKPSLTGVPKSNDAFTTMFMAGETVGHDRVLRGGAISNTDAAMNMVGCDVRGCEWRGTLKNLHWGVIGFKEPALLICVTLPTYLLGRGRRSL